MNNIFVEPLRAIDYHDLSVMVGELLHEIMQKTSTPVFNYDEGATEQRARQLVESNALANAEPGPYRIFAVYTCTE